MQIIPVQSLPADGDSTGAVQITGSSLRLAIRGTAQGEQTLALIRKNAGSGKWFRCTQVSGEPVEYRVPGGQSNGNADISASLPVQTSGEYYHLINDGGSSFSGYAEIESLAAPGGAGGSVPSARALTASGGILGGGDLSSDRAFTLGGTDDMVLSTGALSWTGAANKNLALAASGTGTITLNNAAVMNLGTAGTTTINVGRSGQTLNLLSNVVFQSRTAYTANANLIADPGNGGAIPVTASGVCSLVVAGTETRTLADPTFIGQELTVNVDTRSGGGSGVSVNGASPLDSAGNAKATMNSAGMSVSFIAVQVASARKWRLRGNDGATMAA